MQQLTPNGVQRILEGDCTGGLRLQVVSKSSRMHSISPRDVSSRVTLFFFLDQSLSSFHFFFSGTKKLSKEGQTGPIKYKILVSDGANCTPCIMSSQIASLVSSGEVRSGTIIAVHEAINNVNANKHIVIILNTTIIQQDVPTIGKPIMVPSAAKDNASFPTTAAAPAVMDAGAAAMLGVAPAPAPPQQHYGNAYGAPQPQPPNPYAAAGGGGGYGAPGANGGYSAAPPPNPYGAPPPQPQAGPYGAPPAALPQHNAYGAPPQQQHYGAPPPPQHQQQQHQQQHNNPYGGAVGGGAVGGGAVGGGAVGGGAVGGGAVGGGAIPPQYRPSSGGTIARNEAPSTITPIAALNSYQNRWTIKARVTQKSDIRRYSNAKGEGKFFSFDFLDAEGGEIRVVGWNEQCDRFADQVSVGQVYMLSKASLRNKRGNFNQTRHQFEVHLETGSLLQPVQDEISIPKIAFNFIPLSQLEDTPAGNVVDIIAVVESIGEAAEITRKDGTQVSKRSLNLKDASGRSIELTLWGGYVAAPGEELAQRIAGGDNPIIAAKGVRVGDYNGKTLSTISSTTMQVDPVDIAEAGGLRSWYDHGGAAMAAQALSAVRSSGGKQDRRVTVAQMKSGDLLQGQQAAYIQVLCHISYIRTESFSYPACTLSNNGKQCNKKLVDQTGDGSSWMCERCGATATPEHRYILQCQVADYTDSHWVTAFNEAGPEILGVAAGDLKEYSDAGDDRFLQIMKDSQFKQYVLKVKLNEDTYNDETKIRATVVRADPVDYAAELKWTMEGIKRLHAGELGYPPLGAVGASGGGGGYGGGGGGGYGAAAAAPQQQQQGGWGGGGGGGGYGAPAAAAPVGGYGAPPAVAGGGGYGYGAPQQQQQPQGAWGAPQGQNGAGAGGGGWQY